MFLQSKALGLSIKIFLHLLRKFFVLFSSLPMTCNCCSVMRKIAQNPDSPVEVMETSIGFFLFFREHSG